MARSSSRASRTYPSKIDTWLFVLIAAIIGAMFVGMGMSIAREGLLRFVQGVFVVIGVIGFVVWVVFGTSYTLEGRELIVRSGPFTWKVPLDEIISIEKASALAYARRSPALSFDRLLITYGKNKRIAISPADKEKFLADLRARQKGA